MAPNMPAMATKPATDETAKMLFLKRPGDRTGSAVRFS